MTILRENFWKNISPPTNKINKSKINIFIYRDVDPQHKKRSMKNIA